MLVWYERLWEIEGRVLDEEEALKSFSLLPWGELKQVSCTLYPSRVCGRVLYDLELDVEVEAYLASALRVASPRE